MTRHEYPDLPGFLDRTSTPAAASAPAPESAAEPEVEVAVEPEPVGAVKPEPKTKTKPEPAPNLPACSTATTVSTDDLTILAGKIKAAHAAVGTALQCALDAGLMLIRAKKLVAHGEWLPWIENHCGISARTAQAYMQLAKKVGHLITPDEDKPLVHRHHFPMRNSSAHLSVRAAVKKVAKPKPAKTKPAKTKPAAIDVDVVTDIADVKVVTEMEGAGDDPVVEQFCLEWARSPLKQLFESATDAQRAVILAFINRPEAIRR
jgi:hypothetical protein